MRQYDTIIFIIISEKQTIDSVMKNNIYDTQFLNKLFHEFPS